MKTYNCATCGTAFTRGRGRPPKIAYCDNHVGGSRPVVVDEPIADEVAEIEVEPPKPVIHGATSAAITAPCPVCFYAYADGGYCPECKWALPINRHPHGTVSGRKFDCGR